MSDVEKAIRAFYLFNEKAEKLMRLSFIQAMMAPDTGVTISWRLVENGNYAQRYERRGPGEEAIDAFVLTFRFFIQDNELSSLRMMADHYMIALVQDELRDEFARVRRELNDFLDSPSSINMNYNGEVLTRRKIMETFVYGGMAHANTTKKQLYDEWMAFLPTRFLLESEFTEILTAVLHAIVYIKSLNARTLEPLITSYPKP